MRDGDRKCVGMFLLYSFQFLDFKFLYIQSKSKLYYAKRHRITLSGNYLHIAKIQESYIGLELYTGEFHKQWLKFTSPVAPGLAG